MQRHPQMSSASASLLAPLMASLLALASTSALAGRPLVTEDAGVLERGDCEWESYAGRARSSGLSATEIATQVGCGIVLRTQLAVSMSQVKMGDLKPRTLGVNGKTWLYRTADGAAALTLAYGFDNTRLLGEDISGRFINLVYSQRIQDHVTVHLNYGGLRESWNGGRNNATFWGLGAEVPLKGGWEVLAEVIDGSESATSVGLGLRWNLSKQLSLNASLHTTTEGPNVNVGTLGAKFSF